MKLSNAQIDRLGDRLRKGSITQADLGLLDGYRRSFGEAYETVVQTIRDRLQLEVTGRPAKSTTSIIEKLRRESIRLSQVQDIAGCRTVVADVPEQDRVVASLQSIFPRVSIIDRRLKPTYGYQAVHVIPRIVGKLIEIQIRTPLQHLWAEVSEKCADVYNPALKYGQGDKKILQLLAESSRAVANCEKAEEKLVKLRTKPVKLQHKHVVEEGLKKLRDEMDALKAGLDDTLHAFISMIENEER